MIDLTIGWAEILPLAIITIAAMILIVICIFSSIFVLAVVAIEKIKEIKNDNGGKY